MPAFRPNRLVFLTISYALWAAVSLRWIGEFIEQGHPYTGVLSGILLLYAVLLALETRLQRGSGLRVHLYLAFQTAMIFGASLLYYEIDFFAILYLPLCGQAVFLLPRRPAYAWLGVLTGATLIGQTIQFGGLDGLPFSLLYIAGLIFVASYSTLTLEAETSRRKSEALLAELQAANQQLQEYAGQAEDLAIAEERNRLARDLHDSVAQTLYGLALQSEAAARKLAAGQLESAGQSLQEIRQNALQTLQEIRLMIFELRPPILQAEGLPAALLARLATVERRSGIRTRVEVEDFGRLPAAVENGLYRIAQEALNNVLKHAQAREVTLVLRRENDRVYLEVVDDGIGFEPDLLSPTSSVHGGLGLHSMTERASQMGGEIQVHSEPGKGTRICVEVPL